MQSVLSAIVLVGALILGLLYCFRGYRWLRVFVAIYAFVLGTGGMYRFLMGTAPELGSTWLWVVSIIAGAVLALLAFMFVKFTIFLVGGLLGIAVYRLVAGMNPLYFGSISAGINFLIGLLFFVGFGALTLAAKKHLIIWATAIWGAYTATSVSGILLGLIGNPTALDRVAPQNALDSLGSISVFANVPTYIPIVITAVLAIWGIISQYRHGGAGSKRRR